ncbi:reverse transcriptase family protein [Spartinivicinus poritis]|uniref:Reverse transcriptase family protein n=1 Tax=Spartinivicinus poritis TaxID=2994640 RepID=A0ABT5UEL8_9GAMM|nr:reverse transcriptase family protein [Spartinivicinus sp. A2-2]MDE1464830.1 reverse transcriptase family protein [Spartinivicinus sp. A2-2]
MTPQYTKKPIAKISSLCKLLNITHQGLLKLSSNSDKFFFITKTIDKPDGEKRITFDVKENLKAIHRLIKSRIFSNILYPQYLQGSIKGRYYIGNCQIHTGQRLVISEDIKNFFPSINSDVIYRMWLKLFGFSPEVASILTELVTFQGSLPQGAITSSYIANLVLWEQEPILVKKLSHKGIKYSRYIDDITISSEQFLSKNEITNIISEVIQMIFSIGGKPNRKKHCIMPSHGPQSVHNLNVNSDYPTLPKKERKKLRAQVYKLERFAEFAIGGEQYEKEYKSLFGKISRMAQLHPVEGGKLKERLNAIKPNSDLR